MSQAALDRLMTAQDALVIVLDSNKVDAIEAVNAELSLALAEVRALGAWRGRLDLRAQLVRALKTAEASKARLNYLSDSNRRRLERLAVMTGAPLAERYGRSGRLG